MIVAYYFPHNEGIEKGILDSPGQDTGLTLVDLYEVDGEIRTFDTRTEAEAWLAAKDAEDEDDGWDDSEEERLAGEEFGKLLTEQLFGQQLLAMGHQATLDTQCDRCNRLVRDHSEAEAAECLTQLAFPGS